GHSLLAMLYFESGHRLKAYDEWSMVLTREPNNFDALRGMGFYYLEQEDEPAALQHLERAAAIKPQDPAVQEALRIIRDRLEAARAASAPPPAAPAPAPLEPWQQERVGWGGEAPAPARTPMTSAAAPAALSPHDPANLFAPLMRGGQLLGALLIDHHGLVLAGSLTGNLSAQAESLGAIIGGAIEEAARTATHLSLGHWNGVLLEAESAILHFAPVDDGLIVLLAARRNAPAGWVLRAAQQAAVIATRYLEAYA
ncbi:MAG TPA: roadblock/LC7 domain-containing protein, partial [Longimicrobiales bacterium]